MTPTVSVRLLLGGREGRCSKAEWMTAVAGVSSGPTWMTSYSSSLSACQSKTPVQPPVQPPVHHLAKDKHTLSSHLETRGGETFSKGLNGARLVVLDELGHRVVNSGVSVEQKLA